MPKGRQSLIPLTASLLTESLARAFVQIYKDFGHLSYILTCGVLAVVLYVVLRLMRGPSLGLNLAALAVFLLLLVWLIVRVARWQRWRGTR